MKRLEIKTINRKLGKLLFGYLIIIMIAYAPFGMAALADTLAVKLNCTVSDTGVSACYFWGIPVDGLLTSMQAGPSMLVVSFMLAFVLFVAWTIYFILRSVQKKLDFNKISGSYLDKLSAG